MKVWSEKTASLRCIDIKLVFGYIRDKSSINIIHTYEVYDVGKILLTFSLYHTFIQHFTKIFSIFCQHFAKILSTFHQHFANILPTFCLWFPKIFPSFSIHFANILPTFWKHLDIILPIFCLHFKYKNLYILIFQRNKCLETTHL